MRRRDQVDHHLFDLEPERNLHRIRREQRTEQTRNLANMENNEEQDLIIEQNEPQRGRNGNNGRNQAPRPFIRPDDPFMLLESLHYRLLLFRQLSEDHLFRLTTSS